MSAKISDKLVKRMHADYAGGMSLYAVAEKHGCRRSALAGAFREHGLAVRTRWASHPLHFKSDVVGRWYADYQSGMSMAAVERKYGLKKGLREFFKRRGWAVRPDTRQIAKDAETGCVLPCRKYTAAEITAMIAGARRVMVPAALKQNWKHWPLARRGAFVRKMRAVVERNSGRSARAQPRPTGVFSKNVRPWDYGTREAHEIAARMNVGTCSRTAAVKIKVGSQGVIWRGELWSWVGGTGYCGPNRGGGRALLHRVMWKRHYGVTLTNRDVIRMKDGNWNNLTVKNMERWSRNELGRENHAAALTKKSRGLVGALVRNFQQGSKQQRTKTKHEHSSSTDIILSLRKRSARIATAEDGR